MLELFDGKGNIRNIIIAAEEKCAHAGAREIYSASKNRDSTRIVDFVCGIFNREKCSSFRDQADINCVQFLQSKLFRTHTHVADREIASLDCALIITVPSPRLSAHTSIVIASRMPVPVCPAYWRRMSDLFLALNPTDMHWACT